MPIQQITSGVIADGTVVATDIANGTVTGPKLGANSVSSNNIIASVTLTTPIISGNLNLDSAGTTGVRSPAANTLTFHTSGTEDMRITSDGKVGIGVTAPTSNFEVNGSTAVQSDLKVGGTRYFTAYADATQVILGGIQNTIVSFRQNDVLRMQLDTSGNLQFNSGYGSVATAYGCRVWVSFNGTNNTIRGSGNVSSISDPGIGQAVSYDINFVTAMPDSNFAVTSIGQHTTNQSEGPVVFLNDNGIANGRVRIQYRGNAGSPAQTYMFAAVFR